MSVASDLEEKLFFRCSKSAVKELDAMVAKQNRDNPRERVTRATVLRGMLWRVIDEAKAGGAK